MNNFLYNEDLRYANLCCKASRFKDYKKKFKEKKKGYLRYKVSQR